ncbi:hypothetical protein BJ322DRAFT_230258 [Thelephora terrestris]|uniref:Uncharacterized protein n=1 Tax=Thelephora terrestris TaxID=56493 RepID=A0A9P6H843_9AGAM|nr:hypothetical protein BJ322DRAFT_230258 [Thelephora terrestris]
MASNQVSPSTYPPDIDCFADGPFWDPSNFTMNNCSITNNMVNFLNLTGQNYKPYLAAYCLSPQPNDDCPFGFCPNPDIAGLWVRIANYITGFCVALLIFYAPDRVKDAFWSQVLLTYSLLLTCGISLLQGQLTRFHSIVLISIVCSPVNVYFTGYAIRSFWSVHRLDNVLGKRKNTRRLMVFLSVAIWTAALIYVYLPQRFTNFAQDSCRGSSAVEAFFLGAPFVYAWALTTLGPAGILILFIFLAIPILIIFAWFVAIIRRRREIWASSGVCCASFGKVWRPIVHHYPFLRFCSVVVIPTAYWIAIVELGIFGGNDETSPLTFSQVLAMFATVPPMIEVARLVPRLWRWLITFAWLGRAFGRSGAS